MPWPWHSLLQFGGPLATDEQWSMGLRIRFIPEWAPTRPDNVDGYMDQMFDHVVDRIAQWFQDPNARVTQLARLSFVKWNAIDAAGHYANPNTRVRYLGDPGMQPGLSSGNTMPPQVALAITLRTAVDRGYASRGRVFLPVTYDAVNAAGRVSQNTAEGAMVRFAQLVEAIGNWPGADPEDDSPKVAVVSPRGPAGTARVVTRLSVGDVFDTQRRRRASLTENRWHVDVSQ